MLGLCGPTEGLRGGMYPIGALGLCRPIEGLWLKAPPQISPAHTTKGPALKQARPWRCHVLLSDHAPSLPRSPFTGGFQIPPTPEVPPTCGRGLDVVGRTPCGCLICLRCRVRAPPWRFGGGTNGPHRACAVPPVSPHSAWKSLPGDV